MHITFVGFGWEQLGLSQLSAIACQHGHTTGLAFSAGLFDDRYNLKVPFLADLFNDDAAVLERIQLQQPDLLVFSPLTSTYQWMLKIAEEAKKRLPGIPTVFGGVHVSAVPEEAAQRDQVDYLCVGEGDAAFVHILKAVERGGPDKKISNVWFKTERGLIKGDRAPFFRDLDSLPFFDKTLWEEEISFKHIYLTMASRGCPYRCGCCFNDFFAGTGTGPYVRFRSPEHVINELKWAKERYGLRLIEFEDDVFTMNKPWLKKMMGLYQQEIRLPFQCLTHPKCVDHDTVRMIVEAGCRYVQVGIQSMDDQYKRDVMKRPERVEDVERALDVMKRHGLRFKIDHMFALPGEPVEAQGKALEIYRRYPPYRMQTFWTNYFPGTAFMDLACELGFLTKGDRQRLEAGEVSDDYRNSTKIKDAKLRHIYKAHECCFKVLTVLPARVAKKTTVRLFLSLPDGLLSGVSFFVDLVSGLIKRNPDHWAYARHYVSHMIRRLFRRHADIAMEPLICRAGSRVSSRENGQ